MNDPLSPPPGGSRPQPDPQPTAAADGAPPGPDPAAIPLGDRFLLVVRRPWLAMRAVAERPAASAALGVVFLLMALYTAVNVHILVPEQSEWQLEHVSGEQAAALENQMELFGDPPVWLRVAAGLGAGFSVAIFAVLVPGLLLHVFLRLSEGQGTLRQTVGVVCWAGLIPYGLRTLLSWLVVILTGSGRLAGLTLASFLPDPNPQSVGYMLANLFGDPFLYWMLWVVVLGAMQAHRLSFNRTLMVVAATYVLLSAVPVGFSLLGQVLAGQ